MRAVVVGVFVCIFAQLGQVELFELALLADRCGYEFEKKRREKQIQTATQTANSHLCLFK